MFHLLRTADQLTHRHRGQGKRHADLMKLKKHYKLIHEYQKATECKLHRLCPRLGQKRDVSHLWAIYRSLSGKIKTKLSIVEKLRLQSDYHNVENTLITTLSLVQLRICPHFDPFPLQTLRTPHEDLDHPFTIPELQTALIQGKPKSAHGHDSVTGKTFEICRIMVNEFSLMP